VETGLQAGEVDPAVEWRRRQVDGRVDLAPGQHLLVSGGVGNSTIPIRLGVPPEVVICTVNGGVGLGASEVVS